jgi:hypothetical protein
MMQKLATRLAVVERQRRIGNGGALVALCGVRGMVKQASYGSEILNVMLYPDRADVLARNQLLDAGVIIKLYGSTDLYRLQRLPNGAIEREAFCALIGLACKRERA